MSKQLSQSGSWRTVVACVAFVGCACGHCFDPLCNQTVQADEFTLKDGRVLNGPLVMEKTTGPEADRFLVVELATGVRVLIKPSEIKSRIPIKDAERDYYALVKSRYEDTVEYHLHAAAYCQQNGLDKQKVAHYERVLELDPEEKTARAALQYMRDKDGRWVKRETVMTESRGKVRVGKKWEFPEMVALQERQAKANTEKLQLVTEIRRLQKDVTSGNRRSSESLAKLKALDGPMASAALSDVLFPRANAVVRPDTVPDELRLTYVEVFERLADGAAVQALINIALNDASLPLRDRALDALRKVAPKSATMDFVSKLRGGSQPEINAAGRALAAMGDEIAILPLIEHLTSTRVDQVAVGGPPNIGMNNAGGAGGLTYGNAPQVKVSTVLPNEDVYRALITLTQKDFKYEKQAWLNWYSSEYLSGSSDLRRDP